MKLQSTIVFKKNWAAIHKKCHVCEGSGLEGVVSCSFCGDAETINSPGSGREYKYIINEGSSRSSKTISLIDCYDLYARGEDDKRLTVWRDTKKDCKDTVLKDTIKHLRKTGRYGVGNILNKTDSVFHYTDTNSSFEVHGTDDEEKVHGLEQDAAWFNEPYKISKDTFDQIDQRTSDFIFLDWNPKKEHWIDDIKKDPRAILITSTFKDNPFCPPEQRRKILSYQPVSMCAIVYTELLTTIEAMAYSLLENVNGFSDKLLNELIRCRENEAKSSADAFKWSVYGLGTKAERPNRIFKWTEISIEDYLEVDERKYVGCDWGKVDPWGIVEAKYNDGDLFLRQLNYDSEDIVRSKMNHTQLAQMSEDEEGIVSWMFNKLQISKNIEVICDNNRPMKISMLRRIGWPAYAANKPKGSIIDGIDALDNLNVFFTSDSPDIKHEQENYSRRIDSNGKVLEEPEDFNNHLIDAIRYVVLYLIRQGVIRKM